MVLKLYGVSLSTATRRVAVVCKELNIPYELVSVALAQGEHKGPEFLQKNPFGMVPVIEDDGFTLTESRAICRYLAAKAGSPLLPTTSDAHKYAKFEAASCIESEHFEVPSTKLVIEKIIKVVVHKGTPDENVVNDLLKTLEQKLTAYETILSKQKYLAGNEVTLADLFHLPNCYAIEKRMGYDIMNVPSRPNVARWWKDISSRPSWESVKDGA